MQYFTIHQKNKDLEKAKEIKTFLENNYQENYDYVFLAKKFGMNTNSLSTAFRALTNSSIHEYLIKIRIERAKKLLQTTDLNIMYIAARVGIDKSNLNIHFKKLTGLTPLRWRKNAILNPQVNYHDSFRQTEEQKAIV